MTDRGVAMCLAALLTASPAAAQAPKATGALHRERQPLPFAVEFQVNASYIANFFQVPDELPKRNVTAWTGDGRVDFPFAGRRGRAFLRASGTVYNEFAPGAGLAGGGRWSVGPHEFDATAGVRWRSPRVEVGNQIGSADLVYASGSYGVRPVRQFELSALVDYYRATYSTSTSRNHDAFDAGGAVRYRGFGYEFMPEAGAALGRLDARLDTEDYDQRTFWIAASSIPARPVYLSVRYRHRWRGYSTDNVAASSFGREDTRHQLTITADVGLAARWSWLLYSSFEDARSTRASRMFTTQLLLTGLAYRFD